MRAWWCLLLAGLLVAASSAAAPPLPGPRVIHAPPEGRRAEQGILTPVPVSVELPAELAADRVLVHYRVHGSPSWTTLALQRDGGGNRFRGAIPCLEVSTITGDIRYYIRVHRSDGAVVAYVGSRAAPFVVRVLHDTERPDLRSGARCPDPADCPRGLPGCPSEEIERAPCRSDSDCEGGATCGWDGFCEAVVRPEHWVTLSISASGGLFPGAGACSLSSQENEGYACYRERDGVRYLGAPSYTNEPLRVARAPLRVELGYEKLVFYDTSLGARAGYAFFGAGPADLGGGSFVPWSFALAARHFFGADPFASRDPAAYVTVSAGYTMFDLRSSVDVREDPRRPSFQGGNELEQTLEVWRRAGDAFVALGVGASLWTGSRGAFRAEIDVAQAFPYAATVATLRLGFAAAP